jgi:putative hydrolase of the HAD superfamily
LKRLIRTIYFDFGNVIAFFDHQRAVRRLVEYTDLDAAELTRRLYDTELEFAYAEGKLTTDEFVCEAKRSGGLNCSSEQFLDCFNDIFSPNAEVCELIPQLKPRYRVVLASNTVDAHYRRYVADYAHVFAHFEALAPSHEAGARKPHREYYEYAHRFADAAPAECLFVDDLPANVEAAERFGMKGLIYRSDGTLAAKLRAAGISVEATNSRTTKQGE